MMVALTEMQRDVLGELINMGIGAAAASLSEMTHEEVLLSVPKVEVVPRRMLASVGGMDQVGELRGVLQRFEGTLTGDALLLFPGDQSLALVRAILSHHMPLEKLTDLEAEALLEVGNVILNACLAVLADTLDIELSTALPERVEGFSDDVSSTRGEEPVLSVMIDFTLQGQAISGYLCFLLELKSMQRLEGLLDAYLGRASGSQ